MIHMDLKLSKDNREAFEVAVQSEYEQVIGANMDRNDMFDTWQAQARSDPWWAGVKPRWKNGCQLEDPITEEHQLEHVAAIHGVFRNQEWYAVNAVNDEGEQDAADLEAFLNNHVDTSGLKSEYSYDLIWDASIDTYGILYAGWKETYKTAKKIVHQHKVTGAIVQAKDATDEHEPVEESSTEVDHKGMDYRVVDPADIYYYPTEAHKPQMALRVYEEIDLTSNDLLMGIENFGYDKDVVYEILSLGDSGDGDGDDDENRLITPLSDSTFECVMVYGKAPLIMENGKPLFSIEEMGKDYIIHFHKDSGKIFRMVPSPYALCPYVKFPCLSVPRESVGQSVASKLTGLQQEATIGLRWWIDSMDLALSPGLMVPMSSYNDMKAFRVTPGYILPWDDSKPRPEIAPVEFDKSFVSAGQARIQDTRLRASQIFSAEARGSITAKEQTATEIQNAAAGADEKYDLFVANFNFGLNDLYPIILSHHQQFSDDEGTEFRTGSKTVKITPDMFRKKFIITPTAQSNHSNPVATLQKAQMLYQFMMTNPLVQKQIQGGDWSGVWSASAKVLRSFGNVKDPQSILGKEQTGPVSAEQILEQLGAACMQFAQQGDPGCVQLIQMMKQLQASSIAQGGTGGAPPQPQGPPPPKISISMNAKDMQPAEQSAAYQMAGLPPLQQGPPGQPQQGPPQQMMGR